MEHTTNMKIVQLMEIEKIKKLKARYCRYIDTKKWDLFTTLLAADAHLRFNDTRGNLLYEFFSRDEMVNLTAATLVDATTIHHVHNPDIEIHSATSATAVWAMEDLIFFPDRQAAPFKSMHGFGLYSENLVKKGDDWIIQTLTLSRFRLDYNE